MADTVWDQAAFDNAYRRYDYDLGSMVPSYRRDYMRDSDQWRQELLQLGLQLPGFTPGKYILVVGCGFGWSIEYAIDEWGHNRIWGTDISAFIQSNKNAGGSLGTAQSRPDVAPLVFDIDITDPNAVNLLKSAGAGQNGKFDWVITEEVVEGIDPVNLSGFLDACEVLLRPQGNVGHIVTTELTPPGEGDRHDRTLGIRWRSLEDWVAERPSHYWLTIDGWRLGGGV